MGHDLALYVAAGSEVELRAAVGGKFDDVLIDEACAFGRIASGGVTFEDLVKVACEVSRAGRDAMVLEMSTTSGGFHLDVFRGGRAVRELDYMVGDGWRVRRGEPEPWEAGLPADDFDIYLACELASTHYRWSGWLGAPPKRRRVVDMLEPGMQAALQRATSAINARRADEARDWSELDKLLRDVAVGAAIPRHLFASHRPFYTLLEADGAPHVHERDDGSREIYVYTSEDSVAAMRVSWSWYLGGLALRSSEPLDATRVRELAIAGGARVLALNYQAGRTELYVDLATLVRAR